MTLDLSRIVDSIAEMLATLDPGQTAGRFAALHAAWNTLDEEELRQRLATAKTSFLLATTDDDYRERHPLPALPPAYTLAAADGSMIVPDRHSPARYYLLNIGKVFLRYGERAEARFSSESDLRYSDDDLFVISGGRRIPVNDVILGLRRATAELRAGADLLADLDTPGLVLLDGTLILWSLEAKEHAIVNQIMPPFREALDLFRERRLPVAAYVSSPGAAELMNALRVSVCDYPTRGLAVNCDDCFRRVLAEGHTPACDALPAVTDRYLLDEVARLQPGERTACFDSASKILQLYGEEHRTRYFYVHNGYEIGRVEVPRWVTEQPDLLDLTHAIVVDQCRLGRGYPVALQEAHEMAVLSMADRQLVEAAIERQLAGMGIVRRYTGKDASKRGRFV